MTDWRVVRGKVERFAAHYREPKFHAILCDPPYHLIQGTRNGSLRRPGSGPYGRHKLNTKGFMGKRWDGGGIAFDPDTWAALAEHLHPGAFVMAFGGARTYHRLACAMEDAGLRIHPAMGWLQGQGFPKATRIDAQVDKAAGRIGQSTLKLKRIIRERHEATGMTLAQFNEACGFEASGYLRESSTWANVLPSREKWQTIKQALDCDRRLDALFDEAEREIVGKSQWTNSAHHFVPGEDHTERVHLDITSPATPLAATWEGHRYGLQAIKPCLEFVALAQKPYAGKPVDDITATGAGALWIDGGRIPGGDQANLKRLGRDYTSDTTNFSPMVQQVKAAKVGGLVNGRWPANFALTHSPECRRVGTRRVKGDGHWPSSIPGGDRVGCLGSLGVPEQEEKFAKNETIAAWECVESCAVRRLGEQSGEKSGGAFRHVQRERNKGWINSSPGPGVKATDNYGDKGTAARFFFNADYTLDALEAADPVRCAICLTESPKRGIMSETQSGGSLCDSVSGAKSSLSPSDQSNDSVETRVAQRQRRKSGDKLASSKLPADSAEKAGATTLATTGDSVREGAPTTQDEQFAQSVKSAAALCDLCATAIAQSLVQMQQGQNQVSIAGLDSITEHRREILTQGLVLSVGEWEQTDIIQIMQNQNLLNGIVADVIIYYIQELKRQGRNASAFPETVSAQINAADPVKYNPKAARRERDAGLEGMPAKVRNITEGHGRGPINTSKGDGTGVRINRPARNPHPTVKPITLTQWLATLLLPPDAYAPRRLLVPFAGSGSEMIGAMLAGWDCIVGVEMEREYIDIARARLAWWAEMANGQMWPDVKEILKGAK